MVRTKLIGIDCGKNASGVVVITENGIESGYNIANSLLIPFILTQKKGVSNFNVAVEDVKPYNMRITDGIIHTIKFIGQVEWRLQAAGISFELIPRWEVKQWVFKKFNEMAWPEIEKKIAYSHKRKRAAKEDYNANQQPSFVYVDDRIVQKAMRTLWKIPIPKVGQMAAYGLKDHSWQSLGVASLYIALYKPAGIWKLATFGTWLRKPLKATRKNRS